MINEFIDLSADQESLRAVLQRMALLAPGQVFGAETLTGGVSSNVLKVSLAKRVFCLKQALPKLKVAKDWRAPIDRIFGEIDWLTTASAIVPDAVPRILGVDRQTGCFAMAFLPEAQFPIWKALLLHGHVDVDFAAAVGKTLGLIHARTANDSALAQKFANDDNFSALRLDPYLAEAARHHPKLSAAILAVLERTRDTKIALVHGDVSPKNILVGAQGPVILDAECAWYGDPAFDLAFCLNHLLLKAAHDGARIDDFLAAYARLVAAYLDQVDWEPRGGFEPRAASLLSCLALARVDGKSPAEYLTDDQRTRVRKAAIELIEGGVVRLDEIKIFWKEEMCQ